MPLYTENCTWKYQFGKCSKTCEGGTRKKYTEITKPAKGGGFCPDFVLEMKIETETCNTQPCSKFGNHVTHKTCSGASHVIMKISLIAVPI